MRVTRPADVQGTRGVPAPVLALASLPRIDYADRYTLRTDAGPDATAEAWARAMFGDVPSRAERFIWRGLLGLVLERGASPGTVAGWRIGGRGADWIRLESVSGILAGNLIVHAGDGQVSLTTALHHRRPPARALWTALSAVHRRLAPGLLRDAAAVIRADR